MLSKAIKKKIIISPSWKIQPQQSLMDNCHSHASQVDLFQHKDSLTVSSVQVSDRNEQC